MSSISIRRIIKRTDLIQSNMSLENIAKMNRSQYELKIAGDGISQQIKEATASIERILSKNIITPADLATRSRKAYQWLKFLSNRDNLKEHLHALNRINHLLPSLSASCVKDPRYLEISFYHISPLYKYQQKGNMIEVMIQECFIFAPDQVLRAILGNTLCSPPGKSKDLICQYDLETEKIKNIHQTSHAYANISLSPDGKWVAFIGRELERELKIIPAEGGAQRVLCQFNQKGGAPIALAWTPDSQYILFFKKTDVLGQETLCRIPVNGGELQEIGLSMLDPDEPQVHPNGHEIVFSSQGFSLPYPEYWVMENFLPKK